MAAVIARCIRDGESVGVGENSPIAAAGVLMARAGHAPRARLRLRGTASGEAFWGSKEFFDYAQRGRLDLFFLSGVQIDAMGRINMHVLGSYEQPQRRFPGAFGSAVLYPIVKRVILFRTEHSPRVFVEKVDFVTAAGTPDRVVTPIAVMQPNPAGGRLRLLSYHPGQSPDSVRAATGFELEASPDLHETPAPSETELRLLRGPAHEVLATIYPSYVAAAR